MEQNKKSENSNELSCSDQWLLESSVKKEEEEKGRPEKRIKLEEEEENVGKAIVEEDEEEEDSVIEEGEDNHGCTVMVRRYKNSSYHVVLSGCKYAY